MSDLRSVLIAAFVVFALSCSPGPGTTTDIKDTSSSDPYSVLVLTERLGSQDASCPDGGVEVHSGFDQNGNGVLDTDEITKTYTVCHGAQGQNSLVLITDGVPEGECTYNGKTFRVGYDADGDGDLSESETTLTEYLCNGLGALIELTPLTYGDSNCLYSGNQIESGVDLNGNGLLEDNEIQSTEYICHNPQRLTEAHPATKDQCYYGGDVIYSGVDANGDGQLELNTESEGYEVDSIEKACVAYNNVVRSYVCNEIPFSWLTLDSTDTILASYRIDEFANYDIAVTGTVITDALSVSHTEHWGPYIHETPWLIGQLGLILDTVGDANLGKWIMALERDASDSGSIPLRLNPENTNLTVAYADQDNPDEDANGEPDVRGLIIPLTECTKYELN